MDRGDFTRAARIAQAVVAVTPDLPDAWRVLGKAANGAKNFDIAEQAFAESVRQWPEGSAERARDLLARVEPLICLGKPADAACCVRQAVALGLTHPRDFFLAALALSHLGLPAEALPLGERAVALDPQLSDAWFIVGNARQFLGDVEGAQAAFDTVIEQSRSHVVAAYHALAHLRKWTVDRHHVHKLEKFPCRTSAEACRVGYALFKEYDDRGDIDAAWDCLQHAAWVGRAMEGWNAAEEGRRFDAWTSAFPSAQPVEVDSRPRPGPKRIFIVGLPRSGTTLIERILVSHGDVQTIGEVNAFAIAARRVFRPNAPGLINPAIIAASRVADPLAIAADYTTHTAYLGDGSAYTIDKRPDNYEYAGLIRRAFPDAIIILMDRDPMDALFGAYKRAFAPGAHGWSYTFDDLAAHYRHFRGLTAHWKATLGDAVIEVSLETLIERPEAEIRRLLDRCGLPFDDRCLRPHESAGAVTTASALQVRKPINAQGVGAWKRYERQLAPLRERLLALGEDA